MNVIVIDDQQDVVRGIVLGVNWERLGFRQVFEAVSFPEARDIFEKHTIHLMLCDIEMPLGSGLEVLRWVRAHSKKTECIFLTSHANFSYAKEALSLGCFDYILQPVKYGELEESIAQAVSKIHVAQRTGELSDYGSYWKEKQDILLSSVLKDIVTGRWENLSAIPLDLSMVRQDFGPDTVVLPVLISVLRRQADITSWNDSLLGYAFRNIAGEVLSMECEVIQLEDGCYPLVAFPRQSAQIELHQYIQPLDKMREALSVHFKCSIACYLDFPAPVKELYGRYQLLRERARENVAGYSRVFLPDEFTAPKGETGHIPQMVTWSNYLDKGWYDAVREEASGFLNGLIQRQELTADVLYAFHQNFLRLLYRGADRLGVQAGALFTTHEDYEKFMQAGTSAEIMEELIQYGMDLLEKHEKHGMEEAVPNQVIDQVLRYVQENIGREINRNDLAKTVHLNADYLSRLFKKEMNISLSDYVVQEKIKMSKYLLRESGFSVSVIASKTGYSNFSHFSQLFKKTVGMSPMEYRNSVQTQK